MGHFNGFQAFYTIYSRKTMEIFNVKTVVCVKAGRFQTVLKDKFLVIG